MKPVHRPAQAILQTACRSRAARPFRGSTQDLTGNVAKGSRLRRTAAALCVMQAKTFPGQADVRLLWHLADMPGSPGDVRFGDKADIEGRTFDVAF